MATEFKVPAADMAEAIDDLERLAGDRYWVITKGRIKSDEPLYACGVYESQSTEKLAVLVEAETLPEAVRLAASKLRTN